MTWVGDHAGEIAWYAWLHALLAGIPLVVGLLISLPVGWLAHRVPWLRSTLVTGSALLYTIPSLALFILMPLVLGTTILDPLNVYVAMTLYSVALLVRSVVDGLDSVPTHVRLAAEAMGYTRRGRLLAVELPLAIPVLSAGLRVAAVSNVSIVSVAALIGYPQLGYYLTDGYQRTFPLEIAVGIIGCLVLALLFDLAIRGIERILTPWTRLAGARA